MKKCNLFYISILLGIVLIVFRNWFLNPLIIGGDWPYYYQDFLRSFSLAPTLWQPWLSNGFGGIQPLLGLHFFGSSIVVLFHQWLQIPWHIDYKIGWFGLFIAVSVFGSKMLWKAVSREQITESREQITESREQITESREQMTESREQGTGGFPWWIVASLVYTTNTYILMVTGGGQMGVALSYALAPLVLAAFIGLMEHICSLRVNIRYQISDIRYSLIAGLSLALQLMIDPRIAYVTMVGASLLVVSLLLRYFVNIKEHFFQVLLWTLLGFGFAVGIAALLNAFWIVPMILMRSNSIEDLGPSYTSIESIKFYSFADFSHTLSLLHPNWPENVFGKTSFLKPEFLVLPLLAFAALLFREQRTESREQITNSKEQRADNKEQITKSRQKVVFFALLALVGAFMAKGAQEPFGIVYEWMFTHVPGFMMFRDPTKWYVLIALGYSILIPFTLAGVVDSLTKITENKEQRTKNKEQKTENREQKAKNREKGAKII